MVVDDVVVVDVDDVVVGCWCWNLSKLAAGGGKSAIWVVRLGNILLLMDTILSNQYYSSQY